MIRRLRLLQLCVAWNASRSEYLGTRAHEEAAAEIVVVTAQQRHLLERGDRRTHRRYERRLLVEDVRNAEQEAEPVAHLHFAREAVVGDPRKLEDRAIFTAAKPD